MGIHQSGYSITCDSCGDVCEEVMPDNLNPRRLVSHKKWKGVDNFSGRVITNAYELLESDDIICEDCEREALDITDPAGDDDDEVVDDDFKH